MLSGAPLVDAIGGRAGWELRFVVQGGLRVLEKIDRLGGATLDHAADDRLPPTRRCSPGAR